MENAIYLGLSRQMTLNTNMSIIANNIANANTSGYRGQNLLFQEFISDPRGSDDELSFVLDRGQYQTTAQGSVSFTGNQLDIALEGDGFFGVQDPGAGDVAFTRDGSLNIDANGILVSAGSGFPVAGTGGGNITIPATSTEIKIDRSGVVSNQDGQLGQIQVVEFDNVQALEARGNNLYSAGGAQANPATETSVLQRQLERSNVEPVLEMSKMIETLRTHQSLQRLVSGENERLRNAIQQLTGQG